MAFDLIARGDLVLPEHVVRDGYLAVLDGLIAALSAGEPQAGAKALCNTRGKLVLPGVVDG
jgi:allantoinase